MEKSDEARFSKKNLKFFFGPANARSYEIPVVSNNKQFFSKTALTIFLIFSMNVHHYKGKKLTRRFFRKKCRFFFISNFMLKIAIFEGF